jgi:hypothetical protein
VVDKLLDKGANIEATDKVKNDGWYLLIENIETDYGYE